MVSEGNEGFWNKERKLTMKKKHWKIWEGEYTILRYVNNNEETNGINKKVCQLQITLRGKMLFPFSSFSTENIQTSQTSFSSA